MAAQLKRQQSGDPWEGVTDDDPFGDAATGADEGDFGDEKGASSGGSSGWGAMPTTETDAEMALDDDKPPVLTRQNSYGVLDYEDVSKRRDKLIKSIAEALFVDYGEAVALLTAFRWNYSQLETAYFKDTAKTRMQAGLSATASAADKKDKDKKVAADASGLVQCESAFCEKVERSKGMALSCGHFHCNECWASYIIARFNEGPVSIFSSCMGMSKLAGKLVKCKEMVPINVFAKFLSEDQFLTYRRWVLDSYVDCSGTIKFCPKPGCRFLVEYTAGGEREVTCRCGHVFCFKCRESPHKPAPCDVVKVWREESGEDDKSGMDKATRELLAAKSKQCPNCKVPIIKDRFCNHMHCTKCDFHFCWLCKKPWAGHGSYYECTTYKADVEKGQYSDEEKKMIDSQKVMQKFMWHRQRFDNCALGVRKCGELRRKVENAMRTSPDLGPCDWLLGVITHLEECHRTLQWTFCLAYFLKAGGAKDNFCTAQAELAAQTDALHERLESHSVEELFKSMDKVKQDSVKLLAKVKFFGELGSDKIVPFIQYRADVETSTWACLACTVVNPDREPAPGGDKGKEDEKKAGKDKEKDKAKDKGKGKDSKDKEKDKEAPKGKKLTHCRTCHACRLHGETECKAFTCKLEGQGH